ncbi:LysR substrate-binding domain-containing protein [Polymorphobacter fuscus]|uniref:LysR family transcriptional regulator n=1 Tax=Sandarakinorhabdus fusca TaxID=1439888 RepID=A0A7C9KII6_9SPHN|nr:LysR substrate-binding domain-containing protein [Polymorphobacter fuscus]KAB7646178.1 LysR family transcriptional regulator [Polymorphobacter fuscus]MQT17381.1 LysR family transcriptional regulator [Polymorphobacter fuscus]NJC10085.1 LysR family glycine cleavage system transcriptional activator [Polymorphobacter fuscus]
MKRTHLPLNALRVFDAAARHLSFTKAADELAVTPAAVGQQIRALEDTLGVVLFKRMTRNLELTPEATRALPALRAGFLQFEESVRILQDGQSSKVLTIAAPRDLMAKWLGPRLAAYGARHPDVRFVVAGIDGTPDVLPDFTQANLDLAIVFCGEPADEGIHGRPIGAETLVTVAGPAAEPRIAHPADPEAPGITVADAGLAIDAAAAGLGCALVPATLAAADLAAGRVALVGTPAPSMRSYWLVAPTPQWRQAKVRAMVEFLRG